MIIASVVLGVVMAVLCLSASMRFGEEKKLAWSRAGIAFVALTLLNTITSKVPAWMALILLLIILAIEGYIIYWWKEDGSNVKELITFAVMILLTTIVAKSAAVRIMDITSIGWVIGFFNSIPAIVFVMSVGYMIANMIWFHYELER